MALELIALIEVPGGVPWNPARKLLGKLWGVLDPEHPACASEKKLAVYWRTGEYEQALGLAASPRAEASRAMLDLRPERIDLESAVRRSGCGSFEVVSTGIHCRQPITEQAVADVLRVPLSGPPRSFHLSFRIDPARQCWGTNVLLGIVEAGRDPPFVDSARGEGTTLALNLNCGGRTLRASDVGPRTDLVGSGSRRGLEISFGYPGEERRETPVSSRLDLREWDKEYKIDLHFLEPITTVRAFVRQRDRESDGEWEDLWRFEKDARAPLPERAELLVMVFKRRDADASVSDYGKQDVRIENLELSLPSAGEK